MKPIKSLLMPNKTQLMPNKTLLKPNKTDSIPNKSRFMPIKRQNTDYKVGSKLAFLHNSSQSSSSCFRMNDRLINRFLRGFNDCLEQFIHQWVVVS